MSDAPTAWVEYNFTLVLSGVPDLTPEIEDALFAAGCDDATLSVQAGNFYAEFFRSAPSVEEALQSAIGDVRRAGIGAGVLRIDNCDSPVSDPSGRQAEPVAARGFEPAGSA